MGIKKTKTKTRKKTAIKKSSIMHKMRAKIKQKNRNLRKKLKRKFQCQLTLYVCQSSQMKFFAKKFVWIVEQKSYDIMNA